MKKKMCLRVSAFICALVIGFSSPVGAVCSIQAQAASLAGPAELQLWQLLFSVLGLGFSFGEACDVSEVQAYYDNWYSGLSEESKVKLDGFNGSLTEFIENDILTIPEKIWEGLKEFASSIVGELTPTYKPLSNKTIQSMSKEEFENFVIQSLSIPENVFNTSAYESFIDYFITRVYSNGCLNFLAGVNFYDSGVVHYVVNIISDDGYFYIRKDASGEIPVSGLEYDFYIYVSSSGSVSFDKSSSVSHKLYYQRADIPIFSVGGYLYDFDSVVYYDGVNTTKKYYISDFAMPSSNVISSSSEMYFPTTIGASISDVYAAAAYDVLAPGRTFDKEKGEVVGDVVIGIPSTDVMEGYNEGAVSWEELMDEAGVHPVDTTTEQSLIQTDTSISDALVGIDASVDGISAFVEAIWKTLTGLVDGILDGIVGLFVPAEGFIAEKLDILGNEFNRFGFSSFDMGSIFELDSNENPFKDIVVHIRGQDVVIVSFEHLDMFLNKFRPVIRGLLVLFMIYYSVNQFLALLRLSGMMEGSNVNSISSESNGTEVRRL